MQIVCPSCSRRYELDAAKLGPAGRKVRCAGCQTLWHVDPVFPEPPSEAETQALLDAELQRGPEEQPEDHDMAVAAPETIPDPQPEPTIAPVRAPPRQRKRKRMTRDQLRQRAVALPAALALAGFALIGLLFWQRETAVRLAPQLAGLFEKLGKPVNIRGLSLGAIDSGLVEDAQGRFLVVEGDVTNITGRDTPVPLIEVAVKDAAGQTLYTWTTEPPRKTLEPAELMRFRARLAAPPENGRSVQVRFASAAAIRQADAKPARAGP